MTLFILTVPVCLLISCFSLYVALAQAHLYHPQTCLQFPASRHINTSDPKSYKYTARSFSQTSWGSFKTNTLLPLWLSFRQLYLVSSGIYQGNRTDGVNFLSLSDLWFYLGGGGVGWGGGGEGGWKANYLERNLSWAFSQKEFGHRSTNGCKLFA